MTHPNTNTELERLHRELDPEGYKARTEFHKKIAAAIPVKDKKMTPNEAVEMLAGMRLFVTSRERIKKPEGDDLFDEAITVLRAALTQQNEKNPWQLAVNDYSQKAKDLGVPLIPALPEQKVVDTNPVVAVCGQCGREIRKIEGYYCPNMRCPIQVRCK